MLESDTVRMGMYDSAYEKDACGVGFVVSIEGQARNKSLVRCSIVYAGMHNHCVLNFQMPRPCWCACHIEAHAAVTTTRAPGPA